MAMNKTNDDLMTFNGGTLKAMGGDRVAGHLILFTDENSPDLYGDFFDRKSDLFGLEPGDKVTTLWHHNLDPEIQGPIGKGTVTIDDQGVWFESQLKARAGYEDRLKDILHLVDQGKVGLSSGTPHHLLKKTKVGAKAYHIDSWQVAEASLTCTPVEPRTQVVSIKALMGEDESQVTGMTLADHTDTIIADLEGYLGRIEEYVSMKAKDDRQVTKAKRNQFYRIKDLLQQVIERTEPKPDPAIMAMRLRLLQSKFPTG